MDYNGAGLTFRQRSGGGARRPRGAGLTYKKPFGAGAMDPVVGPLIEGDVKSAAMGAATLALGVLVNYYVIKYAVRAARR